MKKKSGFTLIETIVVIAVIALTLPIIFAIIFIILQQQVKIYRLAEVKRQGDNVLSFMQNTIKASGSKIYAGTYPSIASPLCATTTGGAVAISQPYYILDKNSNWFYYSLSGNNIASYSATLGGVALNTSNVRISSLSLTCTRTATYSSPIIAVSFSVNYITTSTRLEDNASLSYQTRIKLTAF